MARRARSSGVLDNLSRRGETAVKRTVRRVTRTRRTGGSAGGDLVKAVQNLVKALPIGDLEKRLATRRTSL